MSEWSFMYPFRTINLKQFGEINRPKHVIYASLRLVYNYGNCLKSAVQNSYTNDHYIALTRKLCTLPYQRLGLLPYQRLGLLRYQRLGLLPYHRCVAFGLKCWNVGRDDNDPRERRRVNEKLEFFCDFDEFLFLNIIVERRLP